MYRKYANLFEFAPVGYCTLTPKGGIRDINLTAAKQLGMERLQLLQTRFQHYVTEDDRDTIFLHLRRAFAGGAGIRQLCELKLRKADGALFWAQLESILWTDTDRENEIGSECSGISDFRKGDAASANSPLCLTMIADISERKQAEEQIKKSLEEKNVLLKEIHHRTRNNMQVISSLLFMQAQAFQRKEGSDERFVHLFDITQQRINAMALVHEKLYHGDLTTVNLKEYIEDFTKMLLDHYEAQSPTIGWHLELEPVSVSIDAAVPFGLLLHELLSNALQHAFPCGQSGDVSIALRSTEQDGIELHICDNGVGLPESLDFRRPDSLGFQIATHLVEQQLHGTLELVRRAAGTELLARFPTPLFTHRLPLPVTSSD